MGLWNGPRAQYIPFKRHLLQLDAGIDQPLSAGVQARYQWAGIRGCGRVTRRYCAVIRGLEYMAAGFFALRF